MNSQRRAGRIALCLLALVAVMIASHARADPPQAEKSIRAGEEPLSPRADFDHAIALYPLDDPDRRECEARRNTALHRGPSR